MRPVIATDASLEERQLELPTQQPFGVRVMALPGKPWAIISEGRGCLGYFSDREMAQPFLRMLVRNAHRGQGRLDFRLWCWSEQFRAWCVEQRTIELQEVAA